MSKLDKRLRESRVNLGIAAKVARDPEASAFKKGAWKLGAEASEKDAKEEFDRRFKEKTGLSVDGDDLEPFWGKG